MEIIKVEIKTEVIRWLAEEYEFTPSEAEELIQNLVNMLYVTGGLTTRSSGLPAAAIDDLSSPAEESNNEVAGAGPAAT